MFGFAALKPVLVEEGVYHDQCTDAELREGVELCKQQDLRYAPMDVLECCSRSNLLALICFSPSRPSLQMCPRSRLEQSSIAMDHVSVVFSGALS